MPVDECGTMLNERTHQDATMTLSVREAGRELGVSRSRAYELIRAGELPSIKIGRSRRVPRSAIEAYIARLLAEQGGRT